MQKDPHWLITLSEKLRVNRSKMENQNNIWIGGAQSFMRPLESR